MKQFRPTHIKINLKKLLANFQVLKSLNPSGFLCPMIKANAYGHGDRKIAQTLIRGDCRFLGVSSLEEALRLESGTSSVKILCFGFTSGSAIEELLFQKITPVISDLNQLTDLIERIKTPTKVHLKFNTGMNRLGFDSKDCRKVIDLLSRNPMAQVEALCTHLHSAEDLLNEQGFSRKQLEVFSKIQSEIQNQLSNSIDFYHVFNSAGIAILYKKEKSFNYGLRPGLLVYGIDPAENISLKPLIGPVMEFKSKIISVRQVKSGEVISYGAFWEAKRDSLIGIVPAGYADGIPVSLSEKGKVLVKGEKAPIKGRITMDYCMIDLTDCPEKKNLVGEEVIFIGSQGAKQITVEEMSKVSGLLTYEIITGFGERVPRHYE